MRTPQWNAAMPEMPVDVAGNWLHYGYAGHRHWETVYSPFHAELEIDGMMSGRSAKYLVLKDANGKIYPMFVSDLVNGIRSGTLVIKDGVLSANWTGSKKGANYGIKSV